LVICGSNLPKIIAAHYYLLHLLPPIIYCRLLPLPTYEPHQGFVIGFFRLEPGAGDGLVIDPIAGDKVALACAPQFLGGTVRLDSLIAGIGLDQIHGGDSPLALEVAAIDK
jgi:hypothetical protein